MRRLITSLIFASAILAAESAGAAQVSFGIQIGPPPRPRVVQVRPRQPGSEFIWVEGYWFPQGRQYHWRDGYWTRPPHRGDRWIGPRYDGRRYIQGYWDQGRSDRDGRYDRDRNRDGRDRDRDSRDRDRRGR